MIAAFVAGLAAGYGIAIPVGAVAVLIVETGIRFGGRTAAAAGAGAASADGIYAAVAALFGAALAGVLTPWERPLRAAAVVVLAALSLHGLRSVARDTARRRFTLGGSVRAQAILRHPAQAILRHPARVRRSRQDARPGGRTRPFSGSRS